MNDTKKVLSLLGLAQRSGKIASGEFMVEKAVKEGRAALVIIACDASANTKKKFQNMCAFYHVRVLVLFGKDELGRRIGRSERSSLAIMDDGFAKAFLKEFEA